MAGCDGNEVGFLMLCTLPLEDRMNVVNKMTPQNRCEFLRCSRKSCEEVKQQVYSIEFRIYDTSFIRNLKIEIFFNEDEESELVNEVGFELDFVERRDNTNYIEYRTVRGRKLWDLQLDNSADVIRSGLDYFKRILQFHHDNIKKLRIEGDIVRREFMNEQFGIESFAQLEKLIMDCKQIEATQFFSPIRHSLQELIVIGIDNHRITADCEKVYQVRNRLHIPSLMLNRQQVLQLSAKRVCISILRLTAQDVFDFVNSWKNGEYNGPIEKMEWWVDDSIFDITSLFQLFGEPSSPPRKLPWRPYIVRYFYEIVQNNTLEKARLIFDKVSIRFKMNCADRYEDSSDYEFGDDSDG